jgi:hypothetical protein
MVSLSAIPDGIDQIKARYGDPDADGDYVLDQAWFKENIRVFESPFPLRLSWNPTQYIRRFQVHRLVGDAIVDALGQVLNDVGADAIKNQGWDFYGGVFNFRNNRRSPHLSTHAWGIAIDLNPQLAPMGIQICGQPKSIFDAFSARGFQWVEGDWMHAQACTGY